MYTRVICRFWEYQGLPISRKFDVSSFLQHETSRHRETGGKDEALISLPFALLSLSSTASEDQDVTPQPSPLPTRRTSAGEDSTDSAAASASAAASTAAGDEDVDIAGGRSLVDSLDSTLSNSLVEAEEVVVVVEQEGEAAERGRRRSKGEEKIEVERGGESTVVLETTIVNSALVTDLDEGTVD